MVVLPKSVAHRLAIIGTYDLLELMPYSPPSRGSAPGVTGRSGRSSGRPLPRGPCVSADLSAAPVQQRTITGVPLYQ
jgi:hypothetical protein